MKTKNFFLFILLSFLFFIFNCHDENNNRANILAKNGLIDLRNHPFKERDYFVVLKDEINEDPIKLDGEWEFYWKKLPKNVNEKLIFDDIKVDYYLQVPSKWNDLLNKQNNEFYPSDGYAVYRLKVMVKDITPLAIRIPFMSTSYRFYIDDDLVLENGKFSEIKENSIAETSINYVFFIPENKEFYLTFFICNYYHAEGGLWSSIYLGPVQSLINMRTKSIALDLFVSGVFFIMGTYHISLFYLQRYQKSTLYFSLFCFLLALRTLVTGENYLKTIFPTISYDLNFFMIYISIYMGAFVFNQFVFSLYPKEHIYPIKKGLDIILLLLSGFVFILPTFYFTKTLLFFQITIIFSLMYTILIFIKAIKNKKTGANAFLFGFAAFSLFIINDILFANNIINTGYYLTHGFIVFIFSQSFVLTKWFSNAFNQVKELSKNLEIKVDERTRDLNLVNEKLENSLIKAYDLNAMIQVVINSKDIDQMLKKIFDLFSERYNLTCYVLYVDNGQNFLSLYKMHDHNISKYNPNYTSVLSRNLLDINNKNCIHGMCFKSKKSFLGKKIRIPHRYKPEEENILEGNINCFYIIPLFHNNQSFGTITFATNRGVELKNINKEEKEDIENFIKLITPSIYQSLQKNEIEKAYKELKKTQKQLIEAEKMASLGNLISGIAHEINNPIAIIKSQTEFLKNNNCFDLNIISEFLINLDETEKDYFFKIANKCLMNKDFYNTKDSRNIKKEIRNELSKFFNDENKIKKLADQLLEIRLLPPYEQYFEKIKKENIEKFIFTINKFKNQNDHIDNIEVAIEKTSRIIFALKVYLNTNMYLNKRNFDLLEVLERTLYIYNNYINGKIEIEKNLEKNINFFGIKENIVQVFNVIIFNAIQSVQIRDIKKIKITMKKQTNIDEELLNMYSSNDNYEKNGNWIIIKITDSGYGIKRENIEKIFTPFFTTKGLGEGIGLGLYISKKIIDEHDGVIFFSSNESETCFAVALKEFFEK